MSSYSLSSYSSNGRPEEYPSFTCERARLRDCERAHHDALQAHIQHHRAGSSASTSRVGTSPGANASSKCGDPLLHRRARDGECSRTTTKSSTDGERDRAQIRVLMDQRGVRRDGPRARAIATGLVFPPRWWQRASTIRVCASVVLGFAVGARLGCEYCRCPS